MNPAEAGKLLAILATIDRREIDATTAHGWAWALDAIPYERAVAAAKAAIDHGVAYVDVNAIKAELKAMQPRLEADVRAAKVRGIVPETWGPRTPLPLDLEQQLKIARRELWEATNDTPEAIAPINPDAAKRLGPLGKDIA